MYTTPPFSHNYSNPVLMKDDVGKSKPTTYDLPNQQFVYGLPLIRDKEGAKEVTMTWKFHQESQDRIPNRDFPELNKMSISNNLFNAHEMYKFRQTHDARLKVKKGTNIQAIELPEEEFRYGRQNRYLFYFILTFHTYEIGYGQFLWDRSGFNHFGQISITSSILRLQNDQHNNQRKQGKLIIS